MSEIPEPQQHPPHRPADDHEEVYFQGTPVLRATLGALFGWWLLAVVLLAAPFVWHAAQAEWPHWAVTTACVLIGLGAVVMPVVLQKTVHYRVSNYRIDYERGLLSKTIDTLELWHVDDIKFHQSPVDRILSTGTITVLSNDKTTPQLILRGVPNPRPLFDSMKQRVIAVKRQRGVIKMDVG